MLYAFVLGRVYTLSLAELLQVLTDMNVGYRVVALSPEIAVLELEHAIKPETLQPRLGGIIKIIRLFDTFQKKGKEYPSAPLGNYFTFKKIKEYFHEYTGKKQFGVSMYSLDPAIRFREEMSRIAFLIKRMVQQE